MEGPKNALPQEGLEKCTPKPADACDISRRERWLLAVTFSFCLLTVNTLFDAGAGAGWAAAVAGWYAVLYASHGPALWRTGESRFLLVTDLALALFSLVLGSSDYFRMWDTLALLLVLLPVHTAGLSGGRRLPWWRPAMLWERACLLLSGFFSRLGAFPAALSPGRSGAGRLGPAVLGCAGAAALLAVLVPSLASADALFGLATADLRALLDLHLTEAAAKTVAAAVMTPFFFSLVYSLRHPRPLPQPAEKPRRGADGLIFALMLAAAAAVYLLFLAVQTAGIFGGADYLAAKGLSYAEWARSGFFQMVRVTALNLVLLLSAVHWSRREGGAWRAVRLLSAVLTAESLLLLLSAAVRMTLYVEAYGLSFKRLLTYWGMGMMAAFLLAAAWKVRRPDFRFCRVVFPLALAGWLVINCVPVDYLVAKDQVDRYLSGESAALDVEYLLYDLSYDTLSQLKRLDGDMICTAYGDWDAIGTARLSTLLEQRRQEARQDCADWRTWSLSAWLASRGGA